MILRRSDCSIYFETLGQPNERPLVLLNGGPGRSHDTLKLAPVWEPLSQERMLVFYDQRGTGRSSRLQPGGSCTLKDQLDDLDTLRTHLGAEEIDLLGHSWGGYLGMAYCAHYGPRVRRLVLVGSAAPRIQDTVGLAREFFPEITEQREQLKFAMRLGDEEALQASERLWRSLTIHQPQKREAFLRMAGPSVIHLDVASALNGELQRFDLRPELPRLQQPTLVLTGRYDLVVAPSVAYEIHKALTDSRFIVFEESGHRPHFEEPEQFLHVVSGFLRDE